MLATRSGDMKLVTGKKFMLIGTPQGHEIKDPHGILNSSASFYRKDAYEDATLELEFLPDVVNDLDLDFSANPAAAQQYMNDQRNRRKVQEHTKKLKVNIINPLREGKRLLVLDIDYSGCSVTLQAHRRPRRRLMTPFSDSGHEATDVWRAPATRVCAPWDAGAGFVRCSASTRGVRECVERGHGRWDARHPRRAHRSGPTGHRRVSLGVG